MAKGNHYLLLKEQRKQGGMLKPSRHNPTLQQRKAVCSSDISTACHPPSLYKGYMTTIQWLEKTKRSAQNEMGWFHQHDLNSAWPRFHQCCPASIPSMLPRWSLTGLEPEQSSYVKYVFCWPIWITEQHMKVYNVVNHRVVTCRGFIVCPQLKKSYKHEHGYVHEH